MSARWRAASIGRGGLVGERAQRLEALGGREEVVARVVGPDRADGRAVAVLQRHEQPVPAPRQRPVAVGGRDVDGLEDLGDQLVRALAVQQHAALGLVRGVQQRRHLRQRRLRQEGDVGVASSRPRRGARGRRRRPRRASRRPCRSRAPRGSPSQTSPSASSARTRPVRPAETRSRCSTARRWRLVVLGGLLRARSPARRARRRRRARRARARRAAGPSSGSSSESTPSSVSPAPCSGTNSPSSGCHASGPCRRRPSGTQVTMPSPHVMLLAADDVGAVAGEARVEHLLPRRARVRGAQERRAALVEAPCTTRTSKSSNAGRCRLTTTTRQPSEFATARAIASSTGSSPPRSRIACATSSSPRKCASAPGSPATG